VKGPPAVLCVIVASVVLTACQAISTTSAKPGGPPSQSAQTAVGYATSILDMAALPVGAEPALHLPDALIDGAGVPAFPDLIDVHRTFLLSHPLSLGRFVKQHSPQTAGIQTGADPNNHYEAGYSLSQPITPRTCCSTNRWEQRRAAKKSYASTSTSNGRPSAPCMCRQEP
jgi:hypothetical protein